MTRDEVLKRLTRWAEVVNECEAVHAELAALTMCAPEGRLQTAMWAAVGAYGEALETVLIGSAASNWLEWDWLENGMGERAMKVVTDSGEREIDSIERLADLLMECRP